MSFDSIKPKEVSKNLSNQILNKSSNYIEPQAKTVILKYLGVFVLSIFFSLVVCPQNGVGLIRSDFPIYHSIFHNNMLLCGLYCGFIFFMTTHLISFYFLNHFERIIIFKKMGYLPVVCTSIFFAFSMTPLFSSVDFSVLYTFGWLGASFLAILCHKRVFLTKVGTY